MGGVFALFPLTFRTESRACHRRGYNRPEGGASFSLGGLGLGLPMETRVFVLGSFVAACSANVERLPAPGETLAATGFLLEAGGKGLNVAIGLRRLGLAVDGLIAAGDDLFGTLAAAALAEADLPAGMLRRVPGGSGAGVGLVDAAGETLIAVHPGANHLLSAEHVVSAEGDLRAARFVIAPFEIADAPIAAAFAMAAPGAVRILNPSPFRPIDPAILRHTDVLVVNQAEATDLARSLDVPVAGPDAPPAGWDPLAAAAHGAGIETLVVTRGAKDATLWSRGRAPIVQPSFAVECVDGIGAGDAFLAGLVKALASGLSSAEALRTAAACGALATTRSGAAHALPTPAEVAAFLPNNSTPLTMD